MSAFNEEGSGGDQHVPRVRGDVKGLDPKGRTKELYRGNSRSSIRNSPHGPVTYRNPNHPWLDQK